MFKYVVAQLTILSFGAVLCYLSPSDMGFDDMSALGRFGAADLALDRQAIRSPLDNGDVFKDSSVRDVEHLEHSSLWGHKYMTGYKFKYFECQIFCSKNQFLKER